MKKKLFLMVALVLCALGSVFADTYYKSEAEFYRDFEQKARRYQYVYVIEFDDESDEGFIGEIWGEGDDIDALEYSGKYEMISALFTNDWEEVEKGISEGFEDRYYHWRRIDLSNGYGKALNYFKALVEAVK